jgi:hypothetical protein
MTHRFSRKLMLLAILVSMLGLLAAAIALRSAAHGALAHVPSGSRIQRVYVTDDGKWVPLQIGDRMELDFPGTGWRISFSDRGMASLGSNRYLARQANVLDLHANRDCLHGQPCNFQATVIIRERPSSAGDTFYSAPNGYDPITHP